MTDHPAIDAIGAEYLGLSLEIERLFPGFVDAYMGPDEFRDRANAGLMPDPAALLDRALQLQTDVLNSSYESNRKEFLRAQITGIVTSCRKLTGTEIPYVEEVQSSFDITVAYTPDSELDESIRELDLALPGEGSVRDRQIAYRARYVVDQPTAAKLIDKLLLETRDNTRQFVQLTEGESVEIAFVRDKPWSGYNWYLGNSRSLVEINTDLPIYAHNLPALVAHEGYPGHHTEHALKDQMLYHGRGYAEHAHSAHKYPGMCYLRGDCSAGRGFRFRRQFGRRLASRYFARSCRPVTRSRPPTPDRDSQPQSPRRRVQCGVTVSPRWSVGARGDPVPAALQPFDRSRGNEALFLHQ